MTHNFGTVDEIVEGQIGDIEEQGLTRVVLKTLLVEFEKIRQSANARPDEPLSAFDSGFYHALDLTFESVSHNLDLAVHFGQAPVIESFTDSAERSSEDESEGGLGELAAVLQEILDQQRDDED